MSEAPSPELLLAAIQRAETQHTQYIPGVAMATLVEHLDIQRRSHQARKIRKQLDSLTEQGALARSRTLRIDTWMLTGAGRRRLAKARRAGANLALPTSPQHRKWRNAHTVAEAEIDRFRTQLQETLKEAEALLDTQHSDSPMSASGSAYGQERRQASAQPPPRQPSPIALAIARVITCITCQSWQTTPGHDPLSSDSARPTRQLGGALANPPIRRVRFCLHLYLRFYLHFYLQI